MNDKFRTYLQIPWNINFPDHLVVILTHIFAFFQMSEVLDIQFQQELLEKYDQAEKLLNISDPESEPYKSKYECRRRLDEIISLLHHHNENDSVCIDSS